MTHPGRMVATIPVSVLVDGVTVVSVNGDETEPVSVLVDGVTVDDDGEIVFDEGDTVDDDGVTVEVIGVATDDGTFDEGVTVCEVGVTVVEDSALANAIPPVRAKDKMIKIRYGVFRTALPHI